jgi:hypothetical protein
MASVRSHVLAQYLDTASLPDAGVLPRAAHAQTVAA